jgi:hypothetical protein
MADIDRETLDKMSAALDIFHTLSGRIASQYALLEHSINQTIWRLAEVQPALGACITTQIGSTTSKLKTVVALLSLRDSSEHLIKKVNEFTQKNYSIADLRNRAVHDPWSWSGDGDVAQIRVCIEKNQLTISSYPVSVEAVNDILKRVSAQMQSMVALHHDIVGWLETSPQKWRETLPAMSLGELAHLESES